MVQKQTFYNESIFRWYAKDDGGGYQTYCWSENFYRFLSSSVKQKFRNIEWLLVKIKHFVKYLLHEAFTTFYILGKILDF